MRFRNLLFWVHLVCGIAAGVLIVIMSATGVAIAFEAEILDHIDRDLRRVSVPEGASRRPLTELSAEIARQHPGFGPTMIVIPRAQDEAYLVRAGREGMLYVDPYTGRASVPASTGAHDVLHTLEDWHRVLGMKGEDRELGKKINGVANLVFLLLCVTGLYLWLPRKWTRKALRPILVFVRTKGGKARDFNWHNVIGFWTLPVLVVLVASAVPFSFEWANGLVYTFAGETAPKARGAGILGVPDAPVPPPEEGMSALDYDEIVARVAARFPERLAIVLQLPAPTTEGEAPALLPPVKLAVMEPALFSTRGRVPVQVDPYRGELLSVKRFEDYGAGVRARVWLRFLHTGEAFGLVGKVVATIATLGSLVLVYTGFSLSYRRFFGRRRKTRARDPGDDAEESSDELAEPA